MFILALALTILSFVAVVAGGIWTLWEGGRGQRTSGPEAGKAIMTDQMAEDEELDQITLAEHSASVFRGRAVTVETSTEISFGEIKAALRAGKGRRVLPMLLAIGGLIGLILFGALALLFGLDDKVIGAVALVVVLYTLFNMARGFARA